MTPFMTPSYMPCTCSGHFIPVSPFRNLLNLLWLLTVYKTEMRIQPAGKDIFLHSYMYAHTRSESSPVAMFPVVFCTVVIFTVSGSVMPVLVL